MSARAKIQERLNTVFRDVFDDEDIAIFPEMTARDLDDWDSLAHITLVLAVEKAFGIQLNAAEVGKLENVGAMIHLLEQRAA